MHGGRRQGAQAIRRRAPKPWERAKERAQLRSITGYPNGGGWCPERFPHDVTPQQGDSSRTESHRGSDSTRIWPQIRPVRGASPWKSRPYPIFRSKYNSSGKSSQCAVRWPVRSFIMSRVGLAVGRAACFFHTCEREKRATHASCHANQHTALRAICWRVTVSAVYGRRSCILESDLPYAMHFAAHSICCPAPQQRRRANPSSHDMPWRRVGISLHVLYRDSAVKGDVQTKVPATPWHPPLIDTSTRPVSCRVCRVVCACARRPPPRRRRPPAAGERAVLAVLSVRVQIKPTWKKVIDTCRARRTSELCG